MYLYLYDAALSGRQHLAVLARIETRLSDLGITGKISRLSPLKNLREFVRDEVGSGVRTVVAVGGDSTFMSVVNEVIGYDRVAIGLIPVGEKSKIAEALGIPQAEEACETIAARRLVRLDLGRANNTYFLSALTIPQSDAVLELDGRYRIKPNDGSYTISICNLRPEGWPTDSAARRFSPSDGKLEALIEAPATSGIFGRFKPPSRVSVLTCRQVRISSGQSVPVYTDGERILKTPVTVEVVPAKLRVIVGKNRVF